MIFTKDFSWQNISFHPRKPWQRLSHFWDMDSPFLGSGECEFFITGLKEDTPFPSFTPRRTRNCVLPEPRVVNLDVAGDKVHGDFCRFCFNMTNSSNVFFFGFQGCLNLPYLRRGIQSDLSQTYSRTLCTKPWTLIFLLMVVQFNTTWHG